MTSIERKKSIATFMNYPTEALAGRITDELAQKKYNNWDETMPVVKKIRETLSKSYCTFYKDWMDVIVEKIADLDLEGLVIVLGDFTKWYQQRLFDVGDSVEVPEPNESDLHQHSFVGTVLFFKHHLVAVEDGEGDVFDIESNRLIRVDHE